MTRILAHRGACLEAPENTVRAFERALELGADGLEFDIRRTRDQVLVCHHDPGQADRLLCECSFDDAHSLCATRGFELAQLDEVLDLHRPGLLFDVELKEPGYESEVAGLLLNRLTPADFVISSFWPETLAALARTHPAVRTGLLLGTDSPPHGWLTRLRELFPVTRARRLGAAVLIPHHQFLRYGFLVNARRFKGEVWTWTVNEEPELRALLADPRVTSVITDEVGLAVRLRGEI